MENNFTDLVLLVGTNPLPNYVVAKYFSSQNKNLERIWLLYSEKTHLYEGTKQFAENIENVLKDEIKKVEFKYVPLEDISVSEDIINDVKEWILEDVNETIDLHLNYTGGTKAMAVHVYRELERNLDSFSASYLDARDYQIRFDHSFDETEDLREKIEIDWNKLFLLHNLKLETKTPKSELQVSDDVMQCILDLVIKGKLSEIKEFCKATYIDYHEKIELLNKPKKHIANLNDLFYQALGKFTPNNNRELFNLLAAFPERERLVDDRDNWLYDNFPISGKSESTNFEQFKKFLEGKWLEAYVHWIIKTNIPKLDPIANVELKNNNKKFEIDVLIKYGYQICGISCGTSDKRKMKPKGFEVILRTRQLGGDEAIAVLVTLLKQEEVLDLEQDLKAATGTSPEKFIILGIDDLHPDKLCEKIKGIFWEEI